MEEFVAYIVKNLVTNPEAVEIRSIEDEASESIKLEIRVAAQDIGKIIGRRGNTIHALRTILRRVCSRLKKKVQIDLIQPEDRNDIIPDHDCIGDDPSTDSTEDDFVTSETCCQGHCKYEDLDQEEEEDSVHHSCECSNHH
ncbi:KH domain-containing protein [Candidatus Chlamydia corallus]|uniref:KH domain-containing protein n=1 Tax=Candidatus Chlamydia corallus TaxID=2038470 RepID=UPI000C2F8FE0|nr:KH domain-containing protein [Candidatus Chlamydia corallus]